MMRYYKPVLLLLVAVELAGLWTPTSLVASALSSTTSTSSATSTEKGKLLVLGGTGFLGQAVCKRAALEGYQVTSLSRRGLPYPTSDSNPTASAWGDSIDYRQGDARRRESIESILNEGSYIGVIHCVGILFDEASGLGQYNQFASGSGSVPDAESSYDNIVRRTAVNAIDVASEYAKNQGIAPGSFPFCFVSAAEVGWPDVTGGALLERVAPDFLKRYLQAKRAVESRLLSSETPLRPIIFRPSLVYSMDRPASYLPVGAFFVGNKIGLPFVDRPVTVQSLAIAIVRSMNRPVKGILRYQEIDELNE